MLKRINSFWIFISYIGTTTSEFVPKKRNIVITNRLAMTLAIFPLLFAAAIIKTSFSGALYSLSFSLFFLLILVLNHYGQFKISRIIMTTIVPIGVMTMSIWVKLEGTEVYDYNYLAPRISILAGSIIPLILFDLKEKTGLIISCILYLLSLYLFDTIHNLFGVGYYQVGLSMKGYEFLNSVCIISLIIIIYTTIMLKWEIQRSHILNKKLLANLEQRNHEIQTQAEELNSGQERLKKAMDTINMQKMSLENLNQNLMLNIKEKDSHLIKANRELAEHNERLKQFSYGISHNLRAPVARVLGLAELLKLDYSKQLLTMLANSTRELDDVVKDFNKVIDLGNDIYSIKEKVDLKEEWLKVKSFLASSLGNLDDDIAIEADFSSCPTIFTIRPLINNIMFNLVSNAIKFRSSDRKLKISIASNEDNNSSFLIIRDNGVGFDEEEVKKDMFKMYKRFHTHVTGKGLGLYLVKIQIDILSGTIQVSSKRKIGTTFTIILPKATELDYQICFENESAILYYNALVNALGIHWKKDVELNEIKETYFKVLEVTRAYQVSSWIWEQATRSSLKTDDSKWVLENVMPQAVKNGLKKVAMICRENDAKLGLSQEQIETIGKKYGCAVKFYLVLEDSVSWLSH